MKTYLYLSCFLLVACASLPQTMKDADVVDVSYTQVSRNIDNHKDVLIRWGGVIIDVENEENFSLVQVLFYPLNYSGRPKLYGLQKGRFVFKSTKFLDPMVYAKDKEITVVGAINGDIERIVGKRSIWVPLIESSAIHLWPKSQNNYHGYRGYGPSIYGHYGYPHFYWPPYWY